MLLNLSFESFYICICIIIINRSGVHKDKYKKHNLLQNLGGGRLTAVVAAAASAENCRTAAAITKVNK